MDFNEFKNKYFEGNEEKAIECFAKERHNNHNLTRDASQWYKIYKSLTDDQLILYSDYCKSHNIFEQKIKLDYKRILSITEEYRNKRKGMIIFTIIAIAFWSLVLIPLKPPLWLFIIPPLASIVYLCVWIFKRNKDINEFLSGKFYIVKSAVSHKKIEEDNDSDSGLSYYYYIYFPGYDKYEITDKNLYNGINCGDEYYLVVFEKKSKRIEKIYKSDIFELSEEFCLSGDKYLIKNKN